MIVLQKFRVIKGSIAESLLQTVQRSLIQKVE